MLISPPPPTTAVLALPITITTTYRQRLLTALAQTTQPAKRRGPVNTVMGMPLVDSSHEEAVTGMRNNIDPKEEYRFLNQVSTLSSSPQRLTRASALTQCCTVEHIYKIREDYHKAAQQLGMHMSNPNLDGSSKHQIHCQHRYNFGRQPGVCKDCWSYLPICVCHKQPSKEDTTLPKNGGIHIDPGGENDDDDDDDDSIFQRVPKLRLPPLRPENESSAASGIDVVDVIMWTHHKEWGSSSNTGSVLVVALQQLSRRSNDAHSSITPDSPVRGNMLMKGYLEHDDQLQQILQPRSDTEIVIPVVLWAPGAQDNDTSLRSSTIDVDHEDEEPEEATEATRSPKREFVSVDELVNDLHRIRTNITDSLDDDAIVSHKELPTRQTVRLVMIAVEGTWNNAKRMVTKLPGQIRALHLSDIELFQWRTNSIPTNGVCETTTNGHINRAVSILYPLRKQKTLNRNPNKETPQNSIVIDSVDTEPIAASKVINTNKVCTVEAVASALIALRAIPIADGDYIMSLADQKVIRTIAFQGKMKLRNILPQWQNV